MAKLPFRYFVMSSFLTIDHARLPSISHAIAGALSMAAGEYISVASQKDTELADVDKGAPAAGGRACGACR